MKKQLQSLDLLKGIGILMIIMVHNRHFIMKDMTGLRLLINYGQMGCQLFFMVSGMALCYSWYHTLEKNTVSGSQLTIRQYLSYSGKFVLRRYLRLAPGFITILCVNLLLNILFMDILDLSPGFIVNRKPAAMITNILFLHGLFPDYINSVFPGGWYIGTTFLLYALFPLLVCLFEKLSALKHPWIVFIPFVLLMINCILLIFLTRLSHYTLYPYNDSFLYYFFTNQLPCFSLGILLFFQERTGFSSRCPLFVSITMFLVACGSCVYLFLMPEQNFVYTVIPSLAGLSFYWLAVCLIHLEKRSIVKQVKHRKHSILDFIVNCGRNSYSMYLVHTFVCWYGMKAITSFLTLYGYEYNDLLLYCLIYIPSVFVIYALGYYMRRLLDFFDKKLRPTG